MQTNLHQSEHLRDGGSGVSIMIFENLQLTPMFISDYIITQIIQLKTALQEIWTQKTNGTMICSKATWHDVGENIQNTF